MEDEKRLMNCITYALGEVKPAYQRRQMQVLESHLRLVNSVTESINQLSQEQLAGHCFRSSMQKLPLHLQFVPINLHLQQSLFANTNDLNGTNSANHNHESSSNHVDPSESNSSWSSPLNVFTHGAFCVHALGLDHGCDRTFRELCGQSRNEIEIGNSSLNTTHSIGSKGSNRTQLGHTWSAMDTYFRITHLGQQVSRLTNDLMQLLEQLNQAQIKLNKPIESEKTDATTNKTPGSTIEFLNDSQIKAIGPSQLQFNQLQQRFAVQQQTCIAHHQRLKSKVLSVFSKLEFECQQIATLLDPNRTEEVLAQMDEFRITSNASTNGSEYNHNHVSSVATEPNHLMKSRSSLSAGSGMERTISCPINQLLKSPESLHQAQKKLNQLRRCSSSERLDEANEFEPVELTQLNIRASMISMQSKLNQLSRLPDAASASFVTDRLCARLQEDLQPCVRKLATSVQNLQRTGAVCYALQALKLSRDQLEQFYSLRLRRDALFSQSLSTLVISLLSHLNSPDGPSLMSRLFEQRTLLCMFEGLLSCYADELAMLQDMRFALNELARCVRLKFVPIEQSDSINSSFGESSSSNSYKRPNSSHMSGPRLEGNG